MQQHLYKFLVLYRKLSIPQLGSFTIENEPARFDVSSGLLFAPKPVVHFGEAAEPMSDRIFFDFLSEEMGVEEATAIKEFHDFSYKFRNDIQERKLGLLHGVGRIIKGSDGSLFFTPETNLLEFLPPIQLDNTIRIAGETGHAPAKKMIRESRKEPIPKIVIEKKETEKEIEKITEKITEKVTEKETENVIEEEETVTTYTDRWWIYAILLLVTGLVALLFYYQ